MRQYEGESLSAVGQVVVSDDPGRSSRSCRRCRRSTTCRASCSTTTPPQLKALEHAPARRREKRAAEIAATKKQLGDEKATIDDKLAEAKALLGKLKAAAARGELLAQRGGPRRRLAVERRPPRAAPPPPSATRWPRSATPTSTAPPGPSAFDCSGLTMMAWAQAGVALPHSSSAQYGSGPHIAESDLQPGDLVFYYSPISHVGMYIGNGMIVNAENPSAGVTGHRPALDAVRRCGPPWLTRAREGRSPTLVGGRPFAVPAAGRGRRRPGACSSRPDRTSGRAARRPAAAVQPAAAAEPCTASSAPWTDDDAGRRPARWRGGDRRGGRAAGRGRRQRAPAPGRGLHPALRRRGGRHVARTAPGRRRSVATWRFARLRPRSPRATEVRSTSRATAAASPSSALGGGDRRTPLWLSGPLQVRRTDSTLVLVAGSAARRPTPRRPGRGAPCPSCAGCCRGWRLRPGRRGPGHRAGARPGARHADPGQYADIAAVTTTVDGSPAPDAPVHIFVNPEVFDPLEPRGAQIVMSHEATHVATGAATAPMPPWLLEGFADYVALRDVDLPVSVTASQIIRQVRTDGARRPPARVRPSSTRTTTHLGASYESAWLACRLLAGTAGRARWSTSTTTSGRGSRWTRRCAPTSASGRGS